MISVEKKGQFLPELWREMANVSVSRKVRYLLLVLRTFPRCASCVLALGQEKASSAA
jgi:hypothetical protein